jgi:hypothetical protein
MSGNQTNRTWQTDLVASHPELFNQKFDGHVATPGCPTVGDGWRDLVEKAVGRIADAVAMAQSGSVGIDQIKEKFGCLRLYWQGRAGLPDVAHLRTMRRAGSAFRERRLVYDRLRQTRQRRGRQGSTRLGKPPRHPHNQERQDPDCFLPPLQSRHRFLRGCAAGRARNPGVGQWLTSVAAIATAWGISPTQEFTAASIAAHRRSNSF